MDTPTSLFSSGKKILAPLVGGSDLSYRLLCRKYGAQITFTEMCIADTYLKTRAKSTNQKFKNFVYEFSPIDRPLILQLAGNTPDPIIEMANLDLFKGHIDGLDINCGCPQGFAMQRGIGCAVFNDAPNLISMCQKIVKNVPYPVTVKLRIHKDVPTTISILRELKNVGIQGFTVHGREHWQRGEKRGVCDWDAIRQIREAFPGFPIIGNGDVTRFPDFDKFQRMSGVDSIMSGYGALLNPSLFSPTQIPIDKYLSEYLIIAQNHENRWIDILRHISWMLKFHLKTNLSSLLNFYSTAATTTTATTATETETTTTSTTATETVTTTTSTTATVTTTTTEASNTTDTNTTDSQVKNNNENNSNNLKKNVDDPIKKIRGDLFTCHTIADLVKFLSSIPAPIHLQLSQIISSNTVDKITYNNNISRAQRKKDNKKKENNQNEKNMQNDIKNNIIDKV